jgi:hypothetical protein
VDAETDQPLDVIAVMNRRLIGPGLVPLWPTGWRGADETVTDAKGRFTLRRLFFARVYGTVVPEPEIGLLKGWVRRLAAPGLRARR